MPVLLGTTNGPSGTRAALEIPVAAYRPRVTARRCPMRRTPSRRRQFEGRPLAGALSRGRVDGCIRSRRPAPRGADELVGAPAKPLLRARRCQKLKHTDDCPKGWSLTPLRRCVCNAASIRETLRAQTQFIRRQNKTRTGTTAAGGLPSLRAMPCTTNFFGKSLCTTSDGPLGLDFLAAV